MAKKGGILSCSAYIGVASHIVVFFTHFNSDCLFDRVTIIIMIAGESYSNCIVSFSQTEKEIGMNSAGRHIHQQP